MKRLFIPVFAVLGMADVLVAQDVSAYTLNIADGHLILPEHWTSAPIAWDEGTIVPFTLLGVPMQQIALAAINEMGYVAFAERLGWSGGDLEPWMLLGDGSSLYIAAHASTDAAGYAVLIKLDAAWSVLWSRAFSTTNANGGAGIGTDGRVVLFSQDGTLVRFNEDGTHDLALHCPGVERVAVRNDGRIMIGHGDLAALAPDGSLLWNSAREEWSLDLHVLARPDGGFVTAQYALGFGIDSWVFRQHDANDSLTAKTSVSHSPDWYDVRQLDMMPDGILRVAGVRASNGNDPSLKCFRLHPDGMVDKQLGNDACLTAGMRSIALPGDRSLLIHHAPGSLDPAMIVLPDTIGALACEAGPTSVPASVWPELDPWFTPLPYSVTVISPQITGTLAFDKAPLVVEMETTCAHWVGIGGPLGDQPSNLVYPLPASDMLYIAASAHVRPTDRITIRSLAGAILYDGPYGSGVDVSSMAPGVYSVGLVNGLRARVVVAR